MKRTLFLMISALAVAGLMMAATVNGETEGAATAHVYVVVDPNVAVSSLTPIVSAGSVQTGDVTATIEFRVDANKESVYLYVDASDLWKGDDPLGTEVAPIPLNLSEGAEIDPDNANPMEGGSQVAQFTSTQTDIDGFPAVSTDPICFESSQDGHFSQRVVVIVKWLQTDHEKPMGEYSGKVRLWALLMPDLPA